MDKTAKGNLVTKVSMVVSNAQELIDLTEKAQRQSAELRKTLYEIESFIPDLKME